MRKFKVDVKIMDTDCMKAIIELTKETFDLLDDENNKIQMKKLDAILEKYINEKYIDKNHLGEGDDYVDKP
jgi:predicted GNAT superfamily acetyltransferase